MWHSAYFVWPAIRVQSEAAHSLEILDLLFGLIQGALTKLPLAAAVYGYEHAEVQQLAKATSLDRAFEKQAPQ